MKSCANIFRCILPALGVLLMTPLCSAAIRGGPSDQELAAIEFQQNLGVQVSPDLTFLDESGRWVTLGQYFKGKPIMLVLGYYECPMLCTLVMNGMIEALEDLKWTIGNEFEVINISIDPKETPQLAAAKKRAYWKRYGRTGASDGWHFLTGREDQIRAVTAQVGFKYIYDPVTKQYAHPSGLVFLSPHGKVVRYQFGVVFKPADLMANLQQARTDQPGSAVQKLVFLCFHYNPIQGKYGAAIMLALRVLGVATILGLVGGIVLVAKRQKQKGPPVQQRPAPGGGVT